MAIIKTLTDESGTYDVEIVIESDGWSGEPITVQDGTEHFQFDITGRIEGNGELYTCEPSEGNYGHWWYNSADTGSILGMSLEHMGIALDSDTEPCFQAVGLNPYWQQCGAWGAKPSDTQLRIKGGNITVHSLELYVNGDDETYTEETLGRYFQYKNNVGIIFWRCQYVGSGSWKWRATIKTDLPIFETDADLLEYCQSGGTVTSKILNLNGDPEEDYEKARNYRYIWNVYGHNANNVTQYTGYRNYRFYGGDGKICFYRQTPTASDPFTLRLYHYQSYTVKAAPALNADDDDYTTISGSPELKYLHKSIQFESNDYYTKFKWSTDLLIFGSQSQAQQWVDDLIDARSAENFNEVSRAYDSILDPGYGNPDPGNDNGLNGQSYVHGARMWVMSSSQLNNFFDDIFDPVHITDILNGTKLLGDGIQAIQGITYFPLDIDDVATVYSTAQAIKVGSYSCPTAQGRYVQNNNKLLDCGSVFIAPVYNDFRDYKIKLFLSLPYVGLHEIEISKALNHNLQVKYAVDITTGACTAHILFDGISYGDSFDGFMASQRPLTALDQTAYLNSVMGCVSSIVGREAGLISSAKSAIAGVATGGAKETSGGGVSGISGAPSGLATSYGAISDLYGLSQAVKSQPMVTRGGFAGCLGFFGNQQIHIITIQSKTVKPSLEQLLVGYPSHVSQTVGSFSGFLKCSYFKMAAGFSGTLQEWNEIQEIMQGGIYL